MLPRSKPRDAVLDNDDRTIDDQAKVERPQTHQITRDTKPVHPHRCHQHRNGNDQCGDYGGADIAEQNEQDGDHQQCAFEQVLLYGGDRRIDQRGPVINDLGHNAVGERCTDLVEPFGSTGCDGAAVLASAHQHGSHHRLFTVQ